MSNQNGSSYIYVIVLVTIFMLILNSMINLIDLRRENKYDINLYYAAESGAEKFLNVLNQILSSSIEEAEKIKKERETENNQTGKTEKAVVEVDREAIIYETFFNKLREKDLCDKNGNNKKIKFTIEFRDESSSKNSFNEYKITLMPKMRGARYFELESTAENTNTKNKVTLTCKYKSDNSGDIKKFEMISYRY